VNLGQFLTALGNKVDKESLKGLSLVNYSTDEQLTGVKRIDGKLIYQKTYTLHLNYGGTDASIPNILEAGFSDTKTIVKSEVAKYNSNGFQHAFSGIG
jgi:hypothetical protein